jgi:hypothetical protein
VLCDNNHACGDGILWYIDKNSTNIASGGFVNGGSQSFSSGTNGINLNTLSVVSGDVIYLAIHPGGNFNCDDTFVDLAINVTSAPISTPTATITYTPNAHVDSYQHGNFYANCNTPPLLSW